MGFQVVFVFVEGLTIVFLLVLLKCRNVSFERTITVKIVKFIDIIYICCQIMEDKKHFIITGAPSTGKSSVVNELIKRGYVCHDEIARQVIKENQNKNNNLLPWIDMLAFSDEVYRRMIALNKTLSCTESCFLDRSIVDLVGYMDFAGKEAPVRYGEGAKAANYSKTVFFMPFWSAIFANDEQRLESTEEAVKIDRALRQAYINLGFDLVEVPIGTIDERVDFILEQLELKLA